MDIVTPNQHAAVTRVHRPSPTNLGRKVGAHDSLFIPSRLAKDGTTAEDCYGSLNTDQLQRLMRDTRNVHEYMSALRYSKHWTLTEAHKETGFAWNNIEGGRNLPGESILPKFAQHFPNEYLRFEALTIENCLAVIHGAATLGKFHKAHEISRDLPPAYWEALLARTNDPAAWEAKGDSLPWNVPENQRWLPVETQEDYLRCCRRALGMTLEEASRQFGMGVQSMERFGASSASKQRLVEFYKAKAEKAGLDAQPNIEIMSALDCNTTDMSWTKRIKLNEQLSRGFSQQ